MQLLSGDGKDSRLRESHDTERDGQRNDKSLQYRCPVHVFEPFEDFLQEVLGSARRLIFSNVQHEKRHAGNDEGDGVQDGNPVATDEYEEARTGEWRNEAKPFAHGAKKTVRVAQLLGR